MSKKCKFPEIKAELRQREQDSRAIRQQINDSSGMERWGFWVDKRLFGSDTRTLLLGYAFLRGVPYRAVEAKTAPNTGPYAVYIQQFLQTRGHEVAADAIEKWLEAAVPVAEQVAA